MEIRVNHSEQEICNQLPIRLEGEMRGKTMSITIVPKWKWTAFRIIMIVQLPWFGLLECFFNSYFVSNCWPLVLFSFHLNPWHTLLLEKHKNKQMKHFCIFLIAIYRYQNKPTSLTMHVTNTNTIRYISYYFLYIVFKQQQKRTHTQLLKHNFKYFNFNLIFKM